MSNKHEVEGAYHCINMSHLVTGVSNALYSGSVLSSPARSYVKPPGSSTSSLTSSSVQGASMEQSREEEYFTGRFDTLHESPSQILFHEDDEDDDSEGEEVQFGHMSEKTFNKLAAKYNLNDLGVSDAKKELSNLVYRVKKKEEKNDNYIRRAANHSERKLEKREKLVEKVALMESIRLKHMNDRSELRDKFLIEVDKAVEEKNQNIANRRYHLQQVDLATPLWVKKLMDARIIAVSLGHNPALRWRSKTKKVLNEALEHAESTNLSDKFKLRLRKIREVNLLTANEFCVELKNIYTDYMEENTKNDSKLGEHSKAYLEVMAEREGKQTAFPLASHEWSQDLSLGAKTVSSDNQVCLTLCVVAAKDYILSISGVFHDIFKIIFECDRSPHWLRLYPLTQRHR